jgi:hypothetical protein
VASQSRRAASTANIFALAPDIPLRPSCKIGDGHFVEGGNVGIFDGGDKVAESFADQS